jgi:hypothetical protein
VATKGIVDARATTVAKGGVLIGGTVDAGNTYPLSYVMASGKGSDGVNGGVAVNVLVAKNGADSSGA